MRRHIVVVVLLLAGGCKGGQDKDGPAPKTPVAAGAPNVPKVARASELAADDGAPPLLVIVDDPRPPVRNEKVYLMPVRVAVAKSWAALAKQDPEKGAKQGNIDLAYKTAREAQELGQTPEHVFEMWDQAYDLTADNRDDPPPPEEEDKPDDGEDESGGTGTAMALDEGKMGKKDSDRAEGQYKMKRTVDEPMPPHPAPIGERGPLRPSPPSSDGNPTRLADVAGQVMLDGKLGPQHLAILATPRTNAQRLALVLGETGGALVVSAGGAVRPLRIDFTRIRDRVDPTDRWIEVRASKQGFAVEAVPDVASAVADATQLGAAIEKARAVRKLPPNAPVDLLVDQDADAQRLVDLLVALDGAGVRLVGIGAAPFDGSDEAKRRGHRNPTIAIGQPVVQGGLDKAKVRAVVRDARPKLFACFTTALAQQPELTGVVVTQFYVNPKGKVATVDASGVDPAVAKCIAGVLKALAFPAVKGGAQINYPFLLRP
jgi:hypothetical protein